MTMRSKVERGGLTGLEVRVEVPQFECEVIRGTDDDL